MSRNRRELLWKWLPIAAMCAALAVGCGQDNSSAEAAGAGGFGGNLDSGSVTDAGAGGQGGPEAPASDSGAGFESNPVEQLLANPGRNPEGVGSYAGAAAACYANPGACGDAECGAFASCCVNSGACCEPIFNNAPLPALLDFQSCAGQSTDACAGDLGSDATSFSQSDPVLSSRGLIPNGTATAEGGAVIGDLVDLSSQRVELEVQFTLPVGCNGTCLESAGVAFTTTTPDAFVDAEVGLLLSGSREVVNLMIGNEVADSFAAGTDNTIWSLILSPDGSARVLRDQASLGTYSFDAAALTQAQFVVFGRNLGAADTSAAIASIRVEASFCDNPSAWNARQATRITFMDDEVAEHAFGNAPSIIDHAGTRRMAYELDGEIFLSERATPNEFFLDDSNPALVPTEPYEALGLSDPELVWGGSDLFLFYTARDTQGVGRIGMARSDQGVPSFVKGGEPTLEPANDAVSYDAPSVVYRDGFWLLVLRARLSDGASELRAFYTSDPDIGWARVVDGGLEPLTRIDTPTSEVTGPSLIIHNSAYHLYYARRTGTRWSVELAVSDELLVWRRLGEVLGGSGVGFDSLGARSPDALSQPDRVDIVYAGQNAVSFRLGAASRAAPSDTAASFF